MPIAVYLQWIRPAADPFCQEMGGCCSGGNSRPLADSSSCAASVGSRTSDKAPEHKNSQAHPVAKRVNSLQHISDREDLTSHQGTLFSAKTDMEGILSKSKRNSSVLEERHTETDGERSSPHTLLFRAKSNSCSSIFVGNSTLSQPDLKTSLRCVAFATHLHLSKRDTSRKPHLLDVFDERQHPMTDDQTNEEIEEMPEPEDIYRFMRVLFLSAKLSAECAIISLVYLERLLHYAEIDLHPTNWKWMLLGSILLASKVWDDQAVWNVDYCQILRQITVEMMNDLERQLLELMQFNINVESSVYAKYYFDLRTLAEAHQLTFATTQKLTRARAQRLEALSKASIRYEKGPLRRTSSSGNLAPKPAIAMIP